MNKIKLHQLFICLLCCVFLIGCNKGKTKLQDQSQLNSEIHTSYPEHNASAQTKDTLNKKNLQEVYTSLEETIRELQINNANLTSRINEINSYYQWVLLIMIFGWIVVFLIFFLVIKNLRKERRHLREIFGEHFGDFVNLKRAVKDLIDNTNSYTNPKILNISKIITKLEGQISQLKRDIEGRKKIDCLLQEEPQRKDKAQEGEQWYFGIVVKNEPPYFKMPMSSKNEEARFSALITDDVAQFEPLEFEDVKAFDYMDCAIQLSGVSRNSATKMEVRHKGKAQRQGEKWIIVEKASVVLS